MTIESEIRSAWEGLNEEVDNLCQLYEQKRPLIVAVSKTRSIEEINAAYDIGIRDFGENYAQEFEEKAPKLPNANWHFIGHLQRSNVKRVAPYAKYIHTIDSTKLIDKLSNANYNNHSLVQVNISSEISKQGVEYKSNLITQLITHAKNKGMSIEGLMAIGGLSWGDAEIRKEFTKLNQLRETLGLKELSIGMSADYKIAIECGSTMVRIGTKIFGKRV